MLVVLSTCLVFAGCGGDANGTNGTDSGVTSAQASPTAAPTATTVSTKPVVTMGIKTFTGPTRFKIKAGTPIKFVNTPGASALHFLVVGTNGQWHQTHGAPAVFNTAQGLEVDIGKTVTVVFHTPGTYPITCTVHPAMQITIQIVH